MKKSGEETVPVLRRFIEICIFLKERLITQGAEHCLLQHLASCIFP